MITIGCAGFPVPATRYFKEFLFVEVQETHVTQPGTGTIRRWRREAPPGFSFAMLAPREIGQEGFRDGKVIETALKNLIEVGKELQAKIAVFIAPPEFTASRGNKAAVKEFLRACGRSSSASSGSRRRVGPRRRRSVAEPRGRGRRARSARSTGRRRAGRLLPPARARRAQEPLRGPGHREARRDRAHGEEQDATYVFTNVDMFADAKRFRKAAKL